MNLEGKYVLTEGVVLDHLFCLSAPRVLQELALGQVAVALVMSVKSGRYKKKDMLFLPSVELSPERLLRARVLCPRLTMSTVRDSHIQHKEVPELPAILEDLLRCPNSTCITHVEETSRRVYLDSGLLETHPYRCFYCEHQYSHTDLEFLA